MVARTVALTLVVGLAVILRAWPALQLKHPLLEQVIFFLLLRIELGQGLLRDLAEVRILVDHLEGSFSKLVSCLTYLIQEEV